MSVRKKRRRRKRTARNILIIELVLAALVGCGLFLYFKLSATLDKVNQAEIDFGNVQVNSSVQNQDPSQNPHLTGYRTIALVGVDSREDVEDTGNSDTMMIVVINNDTGGIKIVSLYRDTYLRVSQGDFEKANAAYNRGGAEQFLSMLNTNLDLNVTEFVTVDFSVMADMIDLLGGIDMTLTADETVHVNNYCVETSQVTGKEYTRIEPEVEGTYHLNGVQAVSYMRIRKGQGYDFRRTLRQRAVLYKLVDKLKTSDLGTLYTALDALMPNLYTNISKEDIIQLGLAVRGYSIEDTKGFPFDHIWGEIAQDATGLDCVVPVTLRSNVIKLHQFMYPDLEYSPSAELEEYSQYITDVTGYGEEDIPENSESGGELPS